MTDLTYRAKDQKNAHRSGYSTGAFPPSNDNASSASALTNIFEVDTAFGTVAEPFNESNEAAVLSDSPPWRPSFLNALPSSTGSSSINQTVNGPIIAPPDDVEFQSTPSAVSDILSLSCTPKEAPEVPLDVQEKIKQQYILFPGLAELILSPVAVARLPGLAVAELWTKGDVNRRPDFDKHLHSPIPANLLDQESSCNAGPSRLMGHSDLNTVAGHNSGNLEEQQTDIPYYLPTQEARYVSHNTNHPEDTRGSSSNQVIVEQTTLESPQNHWRREADLPYIPREPSHGVQRRWGRGKQQRTGDLRVDEPLRFTAYRRLYPNRPMLGPQDPDED
ncbi:hypothetical protein JR316_0007466 [Psilocybe cubensis]|uniref:Uncharacterized protein n=2 Tax=Psilocybe cubensis TaxID=181762 RepID=A0A8H7XNU0_PSICU|nr:hypothetical protein JR316_0007466 [Psilocybe cubensis]KAH9480864.1 hypothetical protein JR316_0007466 [Psilocybe cubensis]